MTIGFSTKWPSKMGASAGKPNYFVEKILSGLLEDWEENETESLQRVPEYIYDYGYRSGYSSVEEVMCSVDASFAKLHTIRKDPKDLWKVGMKIHPVINNRTKDRYQFAPTLEVKSIHRISINKDNFFRVVLDGKSLPDHKIRALAINDGFDSMRQFFKWFDVDFKGKLIVWGNIEY